MSAGYIVKTKAKYINLKEIIESTDKKNLIFVFKNNTSFNYNIENKKFDIKGVQNNDKIVWNSRKRFLFHDVELLELFSSVSKPIWVKTFFKFAANMQEYNSGNLIIKKKTFADRIEILSKIPAFQKFEPNVYIRGIIWNKKFKTSIKDVGLDSWFLENCVEDENLWQSIEDYRYAKENNFIDLFRYCWINYKLNAFAYYMRHFCSEPFLKYDKKRVFDYLCRDVISQGLNPISSDGCGVFYLLQEYLNLQKNLGESNFEMFPRYLKTAIDVAEYKLNLKNAEIQNKKFAVNFEKLKKFEYESDEYKIVAPQNIDDIVKEGSKLHHCVANYAESVGEGKTKILFLRKKDNIQSPLVTIRLTGDKLLKISMAKGHSNRNIHKTEKDFLSKYVKYLNQSVVKQ